MRKIDHIICHCSGTDNPIADSMEIIREWHLNRKFDDIGYHYVVTKKNGIEIGRPLSVVGAHCIESNNTSIGICLTGDLVFSKNQFESLYKLLYNLIDMFDLNPLSDIYPHRHFNRSKTCPNFSLEPFKELLSIKERNFKAKED